MEKNDGQPNWCLADFVAGKSSGVGDYIGAFPLSPPVLGVDEMAKRIQSR